MSEPFWLTRRMIIAIHDEQLAIHGGASGLRDEGMLDSALDRLTGSCSMLIITLVIT